MMTTFKTINEQKIAKMPTFCSSSGTRIYNAHLRRWWTVNEKGASMLFPCYQPLADVAGVQLFDMTELSHADAYLGETARVSDHTVLQLAVLSCFKLSSATSAVPPPLAAPKTDKKHGATPAREKLPKGVQKLQKAYKVVVKELDVKETFTFVHWHSEDAAKQAAIDYLKFVNDTAVSLTLMLPAVGVDSILNIYIWSLTR